MAKARCNLAIARRREEGMKTVVWLTDFLEKGSTQTGSSLTQGSEVG
jgi:hypothetical protein